MSEVAHVETGADAGEVENMDAAAIEGGDVDNRDQRFSQPADDDAAAAVVEQRQPKGKPDAERALERQRRENRELKARLEALERDRPAARESTEKDPVAAFLEIDEDADPIGAIKAAKRVLTVQSEQDRQSAAERQRTEAQQNQIRALAQWGGEAEADFRVDNPDYDKAVAHLAQTRVDELKAGGYSAQEAQAELNNELLRVMARCKQTGADPADAVYRMAQKRGYVLDNGAKQLTLNDKGQRATSPFAGTGSRSGTGGVSVASVASAPKSTPRAIRAGGDEFDKGFERLKAAAKR